MSRLHFHYNNEVFIYALMSYLKGLRETLEIGIEDMAEYIGITKNHLTALETGIHKVDLTVFMDYCDRLDESYDSVLEHVKSMLTPEYIEDTTKVINDIYTNLQNHMKEAYPDA